MPKPEWFQGPLPAFHRKAKRVRKIYYLRNFRNPKECIREINRSGGRPVRILSHLGIIVGEFINQQGARSLEGHPDVAHWEFDSRVRITDPFAGEITDQTRDQLPWGVQDVGAYKVWPYTKGRGVKVAVIDTGIANDHPAIRKNYAGGVNILSPMFTPYDYNGHGTHVAGTIAGSAAELSVMGVAPRVRIYAVKAFNRRGSANLSDLLSAINWCIENEIDVVNMSFGMSNVSDSLRQAIQTAHRRGLTMVAAAGNQGVAGPTDYPARFEETIGVTSVSRNGTLSSFSNTGKGVDLAAPGEKIASAWLNETTREMSGTSMAVPHVAGACSLLIYLKPDLSPDQLRSLFIESAGTIRNTREYGKLNAYRAAQSLAHYMGRFIP
ncbi:Subtilase family protein [Melghirimyces thermohalophilus]|uniref:Subtilase family protein n=1 Tax=Melghirimyces thermohalophilus TaxID=1236220 RepID=A0A1G6QE31_9BACL|nr:S8 family peptidase [Melghirimyces thermohalophilus]SDC90558.1 Subtilase family protein [Melghirimyces thermohalophilus]